MNAKHLAKSIALASLLAAGTGAFAANDGSLGQTNSEGDLTVTLNIEDRIQVTGLDDITVGPFSGSGNLSGETDFCVYRNGTGLYDLTASSANADGGTFRALNGSDLIPYEVRFDTDGDASDAATIASGTAEEDITGHASSLTCGSSNNASLNVRFLEADLLGASTGAYVDTLTVLVEPQ